MLLHYRNLGIVLWVVRRAGDMLNSADLQDQQNRRFSHREPSPNYFLTGMLVGRSLGFATLLRGARSHPAAGASPTLHGTERGCSQALLASLPPRAGFLFRDNTEKQNQPTPWSCASRKLCLSSIVRPQQGKVLLLGWTRVGLGVRVKTQGEEKFIYAAAPGTRGCLY